MLYEGETTSVRRIEIDAKYWRIVSVSDQFICCLRFYFQEYLSGFTAARSTLYNLLFYCLVLCVCFLDKSQEPLSYEYISFSWHCSLQTGFVYDR